MGVSFNKPEVNARWSASQQFGYELWSDTDRQLAMGLGAATSPTAGTPRRVTRVIDSEGNVVVEYNDVQVGPHPADVLDDCKQLFAD